MNHLVRSNMAGTLLELLVKAGDSVEEGQDVATIESMKMHLALQSDRKGKVAKVRVAPGDFVDDGAPIVELEV